MPLPRSNVAYPPCPEGRLRNAGLLLVRTWVLLGACGHPLVSTRERTASFPPGKADFTHVVDAGASGARGAGQYPLEEPHPRSWGLGRPPPMASRPRPVRRIS